MLGPVVVVIPSVESLQHVIGTSHAAALGLGFLELEIMLEMVFPPNCQLTCLGALEEDHVTAKHLGQGVPVQGGLGEGPGDVVAVLVVGLEHVPPLGILAGHGLAQVNLVPHVSGVGLHVDLEVVVEHVHLLHDTGQVTHLGGNIALKVLEVSKELLEVLLSWLEKSLHLPLAPGVAPDVLPGVKFVVGGS